MSTSTMKTVCPLVDYVRRRYGMKHIGQVFDEQLPFLRQQGAGRRGPKVITPNVKSRGRFKKGKYGRP